MITQNDIREIIREEIKKLNEVEGPLREVSNICDMKHFLDVLYPGYETIFELENK